MDGFEDTSCLCFFLIWGFLSHQASGKMKITDSFRKLTMENQRFEDVSPIKHDDFPRSSEFSEVQYHHRVEMPLQPTL